MTATATPDLLGTFAPNRLGRRPSPITMPGYRHGEPASDRGQKRPPEVLTTDEIRRLIRATGRRAKGGARDRALFLLLWRCGLRISEAVGGKAIPPLMPDDVDLDGGYIRIRRGKGGKPGIVAIDKVAIDALIEWMKIRSEIPNLPADAPLFCTFSQPAPGGRLGQPQVRDRMKILAKKAGIVKKVRPHGFRHTMATDLYSEGVPLSVIQAQLRHEHPLTTQHYIARLIPGAGLEQLHRRPTPQI